MATTVRDMVQRSLTRLNEVTDAYPSSRAPMYERLGMRQRELYVRAAQINPEFYGTSTSVTVSGGIATVPPLAELVQRIEIASASGGLAAGDPVTIVGLDDPRGELAPRVTLRNGQIRQIGSDLVGVTSLTVWYTFLSAAIPLTSAGTTALSLEQPWDELLEIDLAKWLLDKANSLDLAIRTAAMTRWSGDETALLARFDAHVRGVAPMVGRFLPPLFRASR